MTLLFAQADMGTVETAFRLFGPWGAVTAALVIALVYVFRLYHAESRARIADAQRGNKMLEEMAPYLARLARRINRVSRPVDESEPPPPLSRTRIDDVEDT